MPPLTKICDFAVADVDASQPIRADMDGRGRQKVRLRMLLYNRAHSHGNKHLE